MEISASIDRLERQLAALRGEEVPALARQCETVAAINNYQDGYTMLYRTTCKNGDLGMVYGIRFTTSLIVNQPAKYG
jgi:hypothetical protein